MTAATRLPAAAAAAKSALSTAARHERVARARRRCRRSGIAEHDARDDFHRWLQLAAQELCVRAVGNSESHVDGLELLVHVQPDATSRLDRGKRSEQRVNR